MAQALSRWGARFVAKLMDPDEAARLPEGDDRAFALACAIAVKEAASKSIGTGWTRGVRWRDVAVTLEPTPGLELRAKALMYASRLGSHGAARVVVERRGNLVVGQVFLLS